MLIVAWVLMCRHSLLLFSLYLYYGGNSQFRYPLQFSRILAFLTGVELIWVGIPFFVCVKSSTMDQSIFPVLPASFWYLIWYLVSLLCSDIVLSNDLISVGRRRKKIEGLCVLLPFVYKKQHKILKRKYYKLEKTLWAFLAFSMFQMIISVIREQNQTKVLSSNRAPFYCVSWTSLFSQYRCNVEEQSGWGLLYIIFVLYK